jgi:NADP-dependent 3-hydroxy acid dehydrogenase YdfG
MLIETLAVDSISEQKSSIIITSPGGGIGKSVTNHFLNQGYHLIGVGYSNNKQFVDYLISKDYNIDFYEINYQNPNTVIEIFNQFKSIPNKISG